MARVKRGTMKNKRRKNILAKVKGYRFDRSRKERVAKEAILHAGVYAFRDRRRKKREARNVWTLRLNAALREHGFPSYSKFIGTLKKKKVALDRKSLATLAKEHTDTFVRLAKQVAQ